MLFIRGQRDPVGTDVSAFNAFPNSLGLANMKCVPPAALRLCGRWQVDCRSNFAPQSAVTSGMKPRNGGMCCDLRPASVLVTLNNLFLHSSPVDQLLPFLEYPGQSKLLPGSPVNGPVSIVWPFAVVIVSNSLTISRRSWSELSAA